MTNSLMSAAAAVIAGQFFHAAALAEKAGDTGAWRFDMTIPFVIFAASYALGALCWMRVDATETVPQDGE
jgi:hypothetical protein